jgi:predicted enzyme related to lactoylglutathione lyase
LKIDDVELASRDMAATQGFLAKAFGWTFVDHGHGYQAFANAGINGAIFQADGEAPAPHLVILKTDDLEAALPGDRRFHFRAPGGNERAAWSAR